MYKQILIFTTAAVLSAASANNTAAQEGIGERIGQTLDQGLNELGQEVRRGWARVRDSVDRLSVQGRVYSRLHWDKALNSTTVDIEVQNENVIVLSGTVASDDIRRKAVQLAEDTVGVREVVDRLEVRAANP